jgi:hypothetical protein
MKKLLDRLPHSLLVKEDLIEAFNAVMEVGLFPTGERFRHEKRGTVYDVMAFGHANSANEVSINKNLTCFDRAQTLELGGSPVEVKKVLFDRDEVIIYRDVQSGHVGIRTVTEFADGRFTRHPAPPGGTPVDPASALVTHLVAAGAPVPPALVVEPVPSLVPAIAKVADQGDIPSRRGYYDGPSKTFTGQTAILQHVGDGTVLAQFDDMSFTHMGINYGHGWHSFNMMDWSVIPEDGIYKGVRVVYGADQSNTPMDNTVGEVVSRKLDRVWVKWDEHHISVWGRALCEISIEDLTLIK